MTAVADLVPPDRSLWALARRRFQGTFTVDEWGLDTDVVDLLAPLASLRWDVRVHHGERLPAGGALLVTNRGLGLSEPLVVGVGVHRATGRRVRAVGVPDGVPLGPALRRLGGVLDRPEEVAGLLRSGALVATSAARRVAARRAVGRVDVDAVRPAVATGVPVVPVALAGRELGRRWRMLVGEPVEPLVERDEGAAEEVAAIVRRRIADLLHGVGPGA